MSIHDIISMSVPWTADGAHVYSYDHGRPRRIASAKVPAIAAECQPSIARLLSAAPDFAVAAAEIQARAITGEAPSGTVIVPLDAYHDLMKALAKATGT